MFLEKLGRRVVPTIACRSKLTTRLFISRWQSTEACDGPPISETNRMSTCTHIHTITPTLETGAEATKKRFWDAVGISTQGDAIAITLDGRTLKTPSGNTLLLPANKSLLASVIAAEWDHQETLLKPHALPMVSYIETFKHIFTNEV